MGIWFLVHDFLGFVLEIIGFEVSLFQQNEAQIYVSFVLIP